MLVSSALNGQEYFMLIEVIRHGMNSNAAHSRQNGMS